MVSSHLARSVVCMLLAATALTGCQAAKEKLDQAGAAIAAGAETVGGYIKTGAQFVWDKIGPPTEPATVDDGSPCYPDQAAFDRASYEIELAQYKAHVAQVGAVGMGAVLLLANSTAGRIAAGVAAAALLTIAAQLQNDRDLMIAMTKATDDLNKCRARELRKLQAEARASQAARAKAAERLAKLKVTVQETAQRAKEASETMKSRNDTYLQASQKFNEQPGTEVSAEEQKKAAEIKTGLQTNQRVLNSQAASAEQAQALADEGSFELSWRLWDRIIGALLPARAPAV